MKEKAKDNEADEGTMTSGEFFRVWMSVHAAQPCNSRATPCFSDYGNDEAIEMYVTAIESDSEHLEDDQEPINRVRKSFPKSDSDHVGKLVN